MAMQRFTNPGLPAVLTGSLLALYACSFQDFSHLQGGADGGSAGSGTAGAGKGGTSGSSGDSGHGGGAGFGGSAAGTIEPAGGTSGVAGGQSGEAGSSGAESEGGGSAEGGAPAGGTSPGGTTSGGTSGNGGTLAGSGGDAGEPNDAGGEGGEGGRPPLVGNLLDNPGFELGLTGWSVDPSSSVTNRHVYTQAPNPANGTSSSLATWNETQEYSVFIFQNVKHLEPGTYTFKGSISTQATQQAYLFARNCGGDEIDVDIPPVSYEWFEMSIPNIPVSGTSCEVGLFVHGIADVDWLNADGFSFEKDP